jgi:thioesterase domain-containing protein
LALDAEAWAGTYLAAELARTPCLRVVLLGHSYGGALVKSVAEQLEEAGLGDRILLTVLVDAITGYYQGEVGAMPQTSAVFNIYQTNDVLRWHAIDQPNVENWDASGELAPEEGDLGGPLIPVLHTNIENSQAVLDRINERIIEASCRMGLC